MKCPACKNPLFEKKAGNMTLELCYGGCGGIWFDAAELERISATAAAATTLHTIWRIPRSNVQITEPRLCPRCPEQVLDRKWFSDLEKVEIDQCPKCGGVWLDAEEFSRIYEEVKATRETSPLWARPISDAAASIKEPPIDRSSWAAVIPRSSRANVISAHMRPGRKRPKRTRGIVAR